MTPWILLLTLAAGPSESRQEEIETCLPCHSDASLTLTLATGEVRSLTVDRTAFAGSVHGSRLRCTDCHAGMGEVPHPERPRRTVAEYRAPFREACKRCHFGNYMRALDSVHAKLLPADDPRAPSCVECHGSYEIASPARPRAQVSRTCARCHQAVFETYAKSVHGRALLEQGNASAPVCTDCHRSHNVGGPHDMAWLLQSPQLCGRCHREQRRTYLADFHGMTASLASPDRHGGVRVTALCSDCHDVHDIARVDDPGSHVVKANLVKTCRRCHAGATESFPAAWLSHYEPSLHKKPVVWAVKTFYVVFIPFVIGGLLLHVALAFSRLVVKR
jgi:predicted CXXCH cytochrome family protein